MLILRNTSIVGRTNVVNARSFADWGQVPMFLLLKKAKVLFAFLVMTSKGQYFS
jgi:hypothetical protein